MVVGGTMLDSFMNRLGIDDKEMRFCVSIAFAPDEGKDLTDEQVTECLGWVAAVYAGTMAFDTFCALLDTFLKELGNPLDSQQLESIARYMLSGHNEPEAADG